MVLREERIKNNMTQEKLAEEAKITRSQISKIETGVSQPSVKTAKSLAKVLKIDWVKIFENQRE